MENSRPRLYIAGEGACSPLYCINEVFVKVGRDFRRGPKLRLGNFCLLTDRSVYYILRPMKKAAAESAARQRIVQTALDLFYRQGYLATGINQVIAAAGVSKNTFYYYFPSKEDLCVAYLQERHQVWMGWLKATIDQYTRPYDRLMSVFTFLETWLQGCDFRGCAFLNIASEVPDINHRLRKEVIVHKDELRVLLRQLIKDLQDHDPEVAGKDPDFLTEALYVIFEGLISSCQNYGNTSLIAAARQSFEKLLRGAA